MLASGNVTVNAIFEPDEKTFTVTVRNGQTTETIDCSNSTLITKTAEDVDGKTFAYWTKDGVLFTYNSKISFTADDTCTITAVYTDNNAAETAKAAISKITYADGKLIIAANMSVTDEEAIADKLLAEYEGADRAEVTSDISEVIAKLRSKHKANCPSGFTEYSFHEMQWRFPYRLQLKALCCTLPEWYGGAQG